MIGAQPPISGDWVITGAESLSGGSYEVHDGNILIQNGGTLTLDGTEIRMDDTTGPQYYVEVQDGGTLIMRNNALLRSEHNASNYYYFYIRDGATVRVTDSNISDVGEVWEGYQRQGINIESDDVHIDNTDITRGGHGFNIEESSPTITNSTIYDNIGYAITMWGGTPIIKGNQIHDNGYGGPWWAGWHAISSYNSDARIEGNVIEDNGWNGGQYGHGITMSMGDFIIANNTIRNNAETGINIRNHATGKIADNQILWNDYGGIRIYDHSDIVVVRNDIYSNNDHAIFVTDQSKPVIRDNYINVTDDHAVHFQGTSAPVFKENTIEHWGAGSAMIVEDDTTPVISDNTIYSDNGMGIDIWHWVVAVIEGNDINSRSASISVDDFCAVEINDNDLRSRNSRGLDIGDYTKAVGDGNVIQATEEGIQIWGMSDVMFTNTDVSSVWNYGIEVRGRSNAYFEWAKVHSENNIGLYTSEATTDIVNATITAPNNNAIYLGWGSTVHPSLVRATNVTFNQSNVGFNDANSRLNVSWWAERIWVEWQNERAVPFADVWIENVQSNVVYTGNADANGEILWLPVQEYTQDNSQRLDYTRHNFSAEMNGVTNFAGANVNQNLNVRIILQDNVNDPVIDILNPVDEGIYNTSVVWVNGTAEDPESGIFEVDVWPEGLPDVLANGTEEWGTNITLPDGEWTITVNATNYAGVMESETLTITVDTVEPILQVTYPAPVDLVNTMNITVVGITEAGAIVTVNQEEANVTDTGAFTHNITLPEGINTVLVASHDEAMNFNFSVHEVEVDVTPPPLDVFNPPSDIITVVNPLPAAGMVEAGANLTMNGVVVPHLGEPWTVDIHLTEGYNDLIFVATDLAGNTATITREVIYDTTPPYVNITHPPEELLTNETVLNVTGWTEDLTLSQVTVNGVLVVTDDVGNFSRLVNLTEGLNEIEIKVFDAAGHITIVRKKVTLDTIAPPLEVHSPMDGLLTNVAQVHVMGTTELGANVSVNGMDAALDDEGTFDHTFSLAEGLNTITIVSLDLAGNPTEITRVVRLDTTPPVLKVTSPKKGDSYNEIELEVTGTASDEYQLEKVTINGKEVTVKNGKFSMVLALKKGSNKIVIEATDAAGNVVTEEMTVTREGLTNLEGGLLALGIIFLIVGFVVGMLLGKGKIGKGPRPVPEPHPEDEEEEEEEAPPGTEGPDGTVEEDEAKSEEGPGSEPESGPEGEPGPGPKLDEGTSGPEEGAGDVPKKPEGQEAEGEAPPEDKDQALDGILKKLKE